MPLEEVSGPAHSKGKRKKRLTVTKCLRPKLFGGYKATQIKRISPESSTRPADTYQWPPVSLGTPNTNSMDVAGETGNRHEGNDLFILLYLISQPDLAPQLFKHIDIVLEAYNSLGGIGWFIYEEKFRQNMTIHRELEWGTKDIDLWLGMMFRQLTFPSEASKHEALFKTVPKPGDGSIN
ncbi:hypothetical protein XELAEV_18032166mg [Xenopus laevis]|uniref:Uncharacterized protein n=1 Tax=Xenopus laevis TaxID=8355 RepID=A0A974CQ62_XENLA|nr:hypothetical protein XELAEV_18032166mg [Xenopus laevis]